MSLKQELVGAASKAGGGFETVKARKSEVAAFANFVNKTLNVRIEKIEHIKSVHIQQFAAARLAEGVSKRTLAGDISSLRVTLRQAGRSGLADHANVSNKVLGLAGASRNGTKTALAPARVSELVQNLKSPGVKAAVWLQQNIGLRAQEGVRADLETLKRWEKNLVEGRALLVLHGTKGGRKREVTPKDKGRALAAVRSALKVAESNPKGVLISGSLKQALKHYTNEMNRSGFNGVEAGHSLRYAFASSQFEAYKKEGLSEKAALSAVSSDLGHGDDRGRYVKQVYLR